MSKIFGKNLKELRIQKKLYQKDLAYDLQVSQQAIAEWEKGTREPNIETIQQIADYFNVDTNTLLGHSTVKETDTRIDIKVKQAFKEMGVDKMNDEELNSFLHIAKAAAETIKKKN